MKNEEQERVKIIEYTKQTTDDANRLCCTNQARSVLELAVLNLPPRH